MCQKFSDSPSLSLCFFFVESEKNSFKWLVNENVVFIVGSNALIDITKGAQGKMARECQLKSVCGVKWIKRIKINKNTAEQRQQQTAKKRIGKPTQQCREQKKIAVEEKLHRKQA